MIENEKCLKCGAEADPNHYMQFTCGRWFEGGPIDDTLSCLRRQLAAAQASVKELEEVMHWAQAMLTALNVGDVASESPLHKKLRQVMIDYRAATLTGKAVKPAKEKTNAGH